MRVALFCDIGVNPPRLRGTVSKKVFTTKLLIQEVLNWENLCSGYSLRMALVDEAGNEWWKEDHEAAEDYSGAWWGQVSVEGEHFKVELYVEED